MIRLTPEAATLLLPFRQTGRMVRVGLVVQQAGRPPWSDVLAGFLRQVPGLDVRVLDTGRAQHAKTPGWLVDRLYSASRARFDPFGKLDDESAGAGPPLHEIRAAECDIVIWLARTPGADIAGLAKHGVLTVRLGDRDGMIPFWDEVAQGSPVCSASIVWHDVSLDAGRAIRKAELSCSQGLHVTEAAEQPLVAAIRMLAELCVEIQGEPEQFDARVRAASSRRLEASVEFPSNFEAARFAAGKLIRSARLRWSSGKDARWFIAMRPNRGASITDPGALDLSGFRDIALPVSVAAMADPFLWEFQGRQYLLFEELAVGQARGRLGCVELLPDGSCSEMTILLERRYHLSYPCVVASGGDLFLLPETAGANRIELYQFSRFPDSLELVAMPVEGVALVDTTPVCIDSRWYFFTTTREPFLETVLFTSEKLEGPWSLHPASPVSTSVRSCRSAGQLFWRDGRLFRLTQDCSVRYGYGITISEVTRLTPREFEERPASYIAPSWRPGLLATHTWNENAAYQVIDGARCV